MHTAFDLSPLFRSTVGFDRLSDMIDSAFKLDERAVAYPPYNIERLSDDEYRITMAVAGFKQEDLNITVQQNTLTVTGQIAEKEEEKDVTFLHRGIATRSFERRFSLAEHVKVNEAALADGLLTLRLVREVPEAAKPRMIPIEAKAAKNGKVIEGKKGN